MDYYQRVQELEQNRRNHLDPSFEVGGGTNEPLMLAMRRLDLEARPLVRVPDTNRTTPRWWIYLAIFVLAFGFCAVVMFPENDAEVEYTPVPEHISQVPSEELFEAFPKEIAEAELRRRHG